MTVIHVTEFKGYTKEDFLQFLRIHSKSFYEVIIPKELGWEADGEMQMNTKSRFLPLIPWQ